MKTSMLEPFGRYVITSRPIDTKHGRIEPDAVLFCSGIMLKAGVPVYYLHFPARSACFRVQRSAFDVLPMDYAPGVPA